MAEEEANQELSFFNTLYIRALKLTVTAGSFVVYRTSENGSPRNEVCRIVDIVNSIDCVPEKARQPLSSQAENDSSDYPLQFAKVNIFLKTEHFKGLDIYFPGAAEDTTQQSQENGQGWNRIVQSDRFAWLPSSCIVGLAFIAFESDDGFHDFCYKGITNFFVVKYRFMEASDKVSIIPRNECPPFASHIKGFKDIWSVDNCELVFNNLQHIRDEMQRILCRIAQSQGDFATRSSKIQLPSITWHFIKETMASGGVQCISDVDFCHPRGYLTWGLVYNSRRIVSHQEVLRFDTSWKLDVFQSVFGTMSGYGVRKKRCI
jgi:hypothetical protein